MTGNGKPPGHTDRVRELARYIADQPDEITETQIIVQPGASVHVDQTGRHRAMGNEEITQTDHGKPKQDSLPERVADAAGDVLERADTWPRVAALALLVALAAFAAYLRWGR